SGSCGCYSRGVDKARQIRDYWFGKEPSEGDALRERVREWFGGVSPERRRERDDYIRQRFGPLLERAAGGELDGWADSPRRRLSLILLLDQFTRHIHRGSDAAFAGDDVALSLTLNGMQSGADAALDPLERLFFYMPLQHSESLEMQEESV